MPKQTEVSPIQQIKQQPPPTQYIACILLLYSVVFQPNIIARCLVLLLRAGSYLFNLRSFQYKFKILIVAIFLFLTTTNT